MKNKTLQEQIDKFYKETGYELEIKDGKPYYGGYLNLCHTKDTKLPDNLVVGGSFYLRDSKITQLPDNLVVGGCLDLEDSEVIDLPENLVVGGYLNLYKTKITRLPKNLVVGGYLDLYGTQIAKLPDNLVVGGWLYLNYTNITKLPENLVVGDYLDLRHTKITELPENLVVGSYLDLKGTNITKLPENLVVGGPIHGMSNRPMCPALTKEAKKKLQNIKHFIQWEQGSTTYIEVDGIFSVVDNHKGNVWVTHQIGKEETLYVVTDGEGHYAHGDSLKEAKADLLYKINDRDTSSYKNLSLDSELSFEEAIAMYRTITGACAAGTRNFVENRLPEPHKEKYTIKEIIELTDSEYGNKKLKKFFQCG